MSNPYGNSNPDGIVQALLRQIQNNNFNSATLQATVHPQFTTQHQDTSTEETKKPYRRYPNSKSKSNDFYEVVIPSYTPDEFRCYFRMSRRCVALMMEKMVKRVKIFNMEKKFLFTIWMLSTRESFCAVGTRFGLAKGAAYQYFCEIIDCLIVLFKEHVAWPNENVFSHIEQGFKPKTGGYVPGIIGAIDGCHIKIKKPARYSIYCNRMGSHSIILQAVCDHQKIFTDVYVGAPGCLYSQRVFYNSPLSKELSKLIPDDYHIVGKAYYPQMQNLVVPFVDEGMLTETQLHFNDCLVKAYTTIEQAFRLLLARFRRLTYLDTSKPELANKMVCCCVILHNHILMTDQDDDVEELLQEDTELLLSEDVESATVSDDACDGLLKRNYLLSLFEFI